MADGGAPFGARGGGYTFGWNIDNSENTRDRDAPLSPDQRYDTLIHMQKPSNPNAVCEISVPNGTYTVRVVSGDAIFFDSTYRINVEGVLVVSGAGTVSTPWVEGTKTVTVTDGRLTVSNGSGALNNKICFIEITAN